MLLAAMTEEPGRITRRFLTAPMHSVHAHLRARMETIGLAARVDATGNLRGLRQAQGASGKRLLIGSHIDTVPDAGPFDGVLGVTMALELAALAEERGLALSIEVIAFSEEEGVRFGVPFLGSRAVAGRFDSGLLALADRDGTTVESAIRAFGLDPDNIGEAAAGDEAMAFFEMHIEQGPVLEDDELPVAAVTGVVGQTRLTLEFIGQANHAGTTPMALRRDALTAAAEWIGEVEACARRIECLAATVGKIIVKPNAANVVAGSAELSLDVRHMLDTSRLAATEELVAAAGAVAERRGLTLRIRKLSETPAVPMDERLTAFVCDAIEAAGEPVKRISSGAGHDAMVMAARMPTAMLFLRSPGGISHHPAESVLADDVETGLRVAWNFLERLAADVR